MSPPAEQIVALIARSIGLQQGGHNEAALAVLDQAVALAPDFPVTLIKRGSLLLTMGRARAALTDFDRSLARQKMDHVGPLRDAALQGALLELKGNLSTASAYCEYAALLERVARHDEAQAAYRRAVELDAHSHTGWIGLGNLLLKTNRHAEALACYEAVLAFAPADFIALFNRGNALQKDCRHPEALASYAAAAKQRPDFAELKMEQAHCHLAMGDWQSGWNLFESRWATRQLQGAGLRTSTPQWRGEAMQQAVLLLWAEQGFGDTLQFLRYLPMAVERTGQTLLRVPASLLALCKELEKALPTLTVLAQEEVMPPHDAHCPLMSLPLAFGTTPQTIPRNVPYLRVPESRVEKWKDAIGARSKPRIALVWSGGQRLLNNPTRDLPLAALLPLLDATDAEWLSLQKDISVPDADLLARYPQIRRMDGELHDFADTAAILAQCDLLISIDSAVAHLAGAMGMPVWLVLRKAAEWRWLAEGRDSAWYPKHRLWRQASHGQWLEPVDQVREALKQLFQ
jgi:tetratricopeptide (TPR) repeat protein